MAGIMGLDKYFGAKRLGSLFSFGDSGVEFFFVLSGFIITWVHFQDVGRPARLLTYLRKRAARIYPTYWIIFAATWLLMLTFDSNSVPHDLHTLIKALALLPQDILAVGGTGSYVVVTAWSLQYEIIFYLAAAAFIASPLFGALLILLFLFSFAKCSVGICTFPQSFVTDNLMLLFALGVGVAYACKRRVRLDRPVLIASIGAMAFLAVGVFEDVMGRDLWLFDRRLAYGVFSGAIILGLVRAEDTGRLHMTLGWPLLLGDASYSLYLIHFPMIVVLCKLAAKLHFTGPVATTVAFPIILMTCVVSSVVFYRFVERPVLRFFQGRLRPATAVPLRSEQAGASAHWFGRET